MEGAWQFPAMPQKNIRLTSSPSHGLLDQTLALLRDLMTRDETLGAPTRVHVVEKKLVENLARLTTGTG